jgi:hypothetical protein
MIALKAIQSNHSALPVADNNNDYERAEKQKQSSAGWLFFLAASGLLLYAL